MATRAYPVWHFQFWRFYWITMRPYLLFVSGTAGLAGLALGPRQSAWMTVSAFLVFFFSYGFGQALTDCFQLDTDSISSPYRPMVRKVIRRKQVLVVSLAGCGLCSLALFALNYKTLVPAALCVLGLATYTYFKRRWWGGPFYNAWIVALLPLMGKMINIGPAGSLGDLIRDWVFLAVVVSVFLSYANFVIMGYLKDISADRSSGYNTFPVVFGWQKTVLASDLFAVLSLLATGWALWMKTGPEFTFSLRSSFPWLLFVLAAALLLLAQVGAHRTRDEREAHRPIANVVRGFVLLRLAEVARFNPAWTVWVVILYLAFEIVLMRRPEESQV